MTEPHNEVPRTQDRVLDSVDAVREQKSKLLFQYLKEKFELDRQLRLLNVSEQLSAANKAHERLLNEIFLKEAR